jgi:uncharacterized membrane protein YeaQ/YmgE (transglycosylase-associated protein family)
MFIPMNILAWIVVGGGAGLLASLVVKGSGFGLVGDIIIGVIGAFLASLFMNLIGRTGFTGFNWLSLLVAFIGAVVLLGITRMVRSNRTAHA